jgi:hypothetical protein
MAVNGTNLIGRQRPATYEFSIDYGILMGLDHGAGLWVQR